jgi:hypothetical protein
MLKIKTYATIDGRKFLRGINLEVAEKFMPL